MPKGDVQRLKEFGDEISRRFSNPVATVSGEGKKVEIKLPQKQSVNHIVIREDIEHGERVRSYKVKALVDGKWTTICGGESIGNKRIQQFEAVTTNKIRLIIDESIANPMIKELSVFEVK
jgi:alpha-L-fucosidase